MDKTYQILGSRIREVRERSGLSQEEVGARLGMTQPAYGRYETGTRVISIEQLRRLAAVLGKPVEYFLGLDSPLGEDEQELLHLYQGLPNAMKQLVLSTVRLWHEESRHATE